MSKRTGCAGPQHGIDEARDWVPGFGYVLRLCIGEDHLEFASFFCSNECLRDFISDHNFVPNESDGGPPYIVELESYGRNLDGPSHFAYEYASWHDFMTRWASALMERGDVVGE